MRALQVFMSLAIILSQAKLSIAGEELEVNFNTWISTGQTKWRHDASALNPNYGVPTSELDYQGVNSNIAEVSVISRLTSGNIIAITIGTGFISEGTLVDDDYLSAEGADNYGATQSGAHRFSRTHSDINGNGLFYLRGELFPEGFQYTSTGMEVGLSLGVHYWEEEYTATGVRQIECTLPSACTAGFEGYYGVTVITNKVEWTGIGGSVTSLFDITENLAFNVDVTFYPIMSLVNEDTHHLRGDLAQNPSVRMTGNGYGYDFMAGIKFNPARNLSFNLGYRVWERWVEDQTITFYGATGGQSSARLMDFNTRREGLVGGIKMFF